nr:hypothetical protein [Methylobacterium currus]
MTGPVTAGTCAARAGIVRRNAPTTATEVLVVEERREFLAAEAAREGRAGGQGPRHRDEDRVALVVPERVVDALEVVDVEDRDRARPSPRDLPLQAAAVRQPSEGVGMGDEVEGVGPGLRLVALALEPHEPVADAGGVQQHLERDGEGVQEGAERAAEHDVVVEADGADRQHAEEAADWTRAARLPRASARTSDAP